MSFNKYVFVIAATTVYSAVFIATYDALYDSAMILSIALIGLCGWFYGIRAGLFSILPYTLLNAAILFAVSGHPHGMLLACNPLGIVLAMVIAIATGSLKDSCDKLNSLQSSLASRVDKATVELDTLARQLIEKDEQERIQIGQDLHDSVGQYLTGMLLHCEALSLNLREAKRVEADLAERMTCRVQKNIQTVRQLSRSLLPIQFLETNIESALGEMVSYFNGFSTTNIHLTCHGNSTHIPIPTAQHLYRITHEAIYRSICKHKATDVDVKLISGRHGCRTIVKSSGTPRHLPLSPDLISEVIKYRMRAIGGKQSFTALAKGGFRLEFSANFRTGSR